VTLVIVLGIVLDLFPFDHEQEHEHDYDREKEPNFYLASGLTDFLSSAST
jgi:hypothetical protein